MRTSRIILAALAVAAISAQAQGAHRRIPSTLRAPLIDAAAIPAYPFAGGHAAASRAFSHRREAVRTDRHSHPHEITHHEPRLAESESGIVRSRKTGATAKVAPSFAPIAQAVVDDLEQNYGATIKFMGGIRKGPCASWSLHPCGLAIDLCQLSRGVVDYRCHMPSRAAEERIARAHGAYSGGEWCSQDRGHIQSKETAAKCGQNLYSAVSKFKQAARHHRRVRYARR